MEAITNSYRFNIASWEIKNLTAEVGQEERNSSREIVDGTDTVLKYVTLADQIKTIEAQTRGHEENGFESELDNLQKEQGSLKDKVEIIIAQQIEGVLAEQGIHNPWHKYTGLETGFPAVDFRLETPPHLLVISPRNRIETMNTILLNEDLSVESMTIMESELDKLNVSSLVVDLGGLGTYPSIVTSDASLQFMLQTVAHEWTHEYLAFTPLGFGYLLNIVGLSRNPDVVAMNEATADTVGKEVGAIVSQEYYHQPAINSPPANKPVFDFDQEMRNIRKSVDQYLAQGQIDEAEKFMQEKRDYLETQGYYIRKLNQAYFAFNDQYADSPAFISPIGTELNQLRSESSSLGDFLDTVLSMTSPQDLKIAAEEHQAQPAYH